jgi:hypothetical protein
MSLLFVKSGLLKTAMKGITAPIPIISNPVPINIKNKRNNKNNFSFPENKVNNFINNFIIIARFS